MSNSYAVFCLKKKKTLTISPKTAQILETYAWHGNVRELEHTIERAVALERSDEIQPEQLPDHITIYNPPPTTAIYSLSLHDALPISLDLIRFEVYRADVIDGEPAALARADVDENAV